MPVGVSRDRARHVRGAFCVRDLSLFFSFSRCTLRFLPFRFFHFFEVFFGECTSTW